MKKESAKLARRKGVRKKPGRAGSTRRNSNDGVKKEQEQV